MSLQAERNLIGAIILDQPIIKNIYGKLEPHMFTSSITSEIFRGILSLYSKNKNFDHSMIVLESETDKIHKALIVDELNICIRETVTSVGYQEFVNIILCDYKANKVSQLCKQPIVPKDINNQICDLITDLERLNENSQDVMLKMSDVVKNNKGKYFIEKVDNSPKTGIDSIDEIVHMEANDLVIIGARPAVGKSAFATQMILNMAMTGKRGIYYNLEMSEEQVYERMISNLAAIPLKRVKYATTFQGTEKERFEKANEILEKLPLQMVNEGRNIKTIENEIRYAKIDYIVVDYLQLVQAKAQSRFEAVGEVSRRLKDIATQKKIPVIALSQLRREDAGSKKENMMPTEQDLRESGNIEQDASIIMLLWNLDMTDRTQKGCYIAKNRQGETAIKRLEFKGSEMKFVDCNEDITFERKEKNPFDNSERSMFT